MKHRTVVAAVVAAGLPVAVMAQERVTYSLLWSEVLAGSNQPVAVPNGVIEPGEGVRIAIRATITPGIGATATYTPPPPPGTGTIAGFGSMFVTLIGTNVNGGSWSNITRNAESNPGGIPGGGNWTLGTPGTPEANGNMLGLQAGQFVLPGSTANSVNPVSNAWRGTWTPSSYMMRSASFQSTDAGSISGNESSILIQYGIDVNGHPQYVGKFVSRTHGNTGSIPIVPSPGVLPLASLAVVVASRRCRRKEFRP
ncbi:MAG: hypothetical protein ACKVW3_03560 [Phycisphaerales bacterium]